MSGNPEGVRHVLRSRSYKSEKPDALSKGNSNQTTDETPTATSMSSPAARRRLFNNDGTSKEMTQTEEADQSKEIEVLIGKEDVTDGPLQDFTMYLENLITKHRVEKKGKTDDIILEEKEIVKFLKSAEVKFMGFSNGSTPKYNKPKRLMSRKRSVLKNKSKKVARYVLRACTEDTVMAQVTTKSGFSLGVLTGLSLGSPTGGGGLLVGGSYSRSKEKSQGSSSVARREMEASASVGCREQLIATESVYHTDYEADCEFDFFVKEDYELSYTLPKNTFLNKTKALKVKEIGFEECEQNIEVEGGKKVHKSASFQTTLTSVEHEIDFEVEPLHEKKKKRKDF